MSSPLMVYSGSGDEGGETGLKSVTVNVTCLLDRIWTHLRG